MYGGHLDLRRVHALDRHPQLVELSCHIPDGLALEVRQLNAGDQFVDARQGARELPLEPIVERLKRRQMAKSLRVGLLGRTVSRTRPGRLILRTLEEHFELRAATVEGQQGSLGRFERQGGGGVPLLQRILKPVQGIGNRGVGRWRGYGGAAVSNRSSGRDNIAGNTNGHKANAIQRGWSGGAPAATTTPTKA